MQWRRKAFLVLAAGMLMFSSVGAAQATEWGRFYHYPYSYFPVNYRKPFNSRDAYMPYGYPMYPQYQAFPPYFRKDLYYPYLRQLKPGNNWKSWYQGNHYQLDVF
ncbi:hypothetical protein Pan216_09910 [Planctomycetes bacterium Pan216]|uniref:Uncharacterized protein n=1 Tax=Kolteria novifilia TaxID=2527975 RepID=A0A518AZM8_9BACT|nr:hypothetical protein Pan216_09910 [Planctomycetes bacterium Pan216]